MRNFVFDLDKKGIETVFKPYQSESLRLIHEKGHMTSGEVDLALKIEGIKISRASVINFLNRMVDEGFLTYTEKTGKGGYHRIYQLAHTSYDGFIKALFYRIEKHLNSELGDLVGLQTGEHNTQKHREKGASGPEA